MAKIYQIILFATFLLVAPFLASAATLSVTPTSGTFEVGDRITARVIVTSDLPVNAISGTVSIPPIFVIESVSKAGSILNFWVSEPNFSRGAGTLQFEGVALGGYTRQTGNVVTFVLRANKEGKGTIRFNGGQVLANDGQGTDLTSGFGSSSFTITPRTTPPPSIPEPETPEEPEETTPEEEPQEEATLTSPEITLTSVDGQKAILGSSGYSDSQALTTFTPEAGINVLVQSQTDENGNFFTPVPTTLKRGTYTVSTVVIQDDLSYTSPSNQLEITIGNIFSDISFEVRLAIALLIVIVIYLITRVIHYFRYARKTKRHIKEESREARSIVRKSFKVLDKDLKNLAPVREIKKDLKSAEKSILDEIKDIEESEET